MKQKMVISLLLASMILTMTSCGGTTTNSTDTSQYGTEETTTKAEKGSMEETTGTEAKSTEETTETEESTEETTEAIIIEPEDEVDFLKLSLNQNYLEEWEEDTSLCKITWSSFILDDADAQKFPQLEATLKDINMQYTALAYDTMEWLLPEAKESFENREYFMGYTSSSEYYVQRADKYMVSVLRTYDEYAGGVHPNYGVTSLNIDTVTGEPLKLNDVVTDVAIVIELLANKLYEKYDYAFENVDNILAMLNEYEAYEFTWTLGYQDITFYFSPYEIASYAAGLLKITISFDEITELLNEAYVQMPEYGYALQIKLYEDIEIDLNRTDGKKDILYVSTEVYEDNKMSFYVRLNEYEYVDSDYYAYEAIPYLVCVRNDDIEQYFIYVEEVSANGDSNIYTYDLNHGKVEPLEVWFGKGFHTTVLPDEGGMSFYYDEIWNNPKELILDDQLYVLGTGMGYKSFHVGIDGKLKESIDYYTMFADTPWTHSKVDLEVLILPEEKEETISAGTGFLLLRTDAETYIDMRLEDGRECRILINTSNWPTTINGIPELDCFEEITSMG